MSNRSRRQRRRDKRRELTEKKVRKITPLTPYFTHISKIDDRIQRFEEYLMKYVEPLFSEASKLNFNVRVSDSDIGSVINKGKYDKTLKHLSNTINMRSWNDAVKKNNHQQQVFRMILEESNGGTFYGLIKNIEKYLNLLKVEGYEWNVVYYGTYRPTREGLR